MEQIESMASFFASRVEGYDEHMLQNVEGCREAYIKMATLIPKGTKHILDLGCGTGLELDEIFKVFPRLHVIGVDLTQEMLNKLKQKHLDKKLELICGDYFKVEFGKNRFDCAISFETMHHFAPDKKTELYRRICASLVEDGCYIECDWMVESQEEEDFYFAQNDRLRKATGIAHEQLCHFDTPCTIENQMSMLKKAGFAQTKPVFRVGGTTILVAWKSETKIKKMQLKFHMGYVKMEHRRIRRIFSPAKGCLP